MPLVLFLYVSIVVMFCGYKVIYGNLWHAALLDATYGRMPYGNFLFSLI